MSSLDSSHQYILDVETLKDASHNDVALEKTSCCGMFTAETTDKRYISVFCWELRNVKPLFATVGNRKDSYTKALRAIGDTPGPETVGFKKQKSNYCTCETRGTQLSACPFWETCLEGFFFSPHLKKKGLLPAYLPAVVTCPTILL